MGRSTARLVHVTGAVLLGVTLAGCGSNGSTEASSASSTPPASSTTSDSPTPSATPSPSAPASGPNQTVADYLQENGITQTMVTRGDPGTPQLNLPVPPGWSDLGADTPAGAWGAIALTESAQANNPPAIIVRMARLTGGDVDQAKILELAPNAVRNQPGYSGPETGQPATLGGFAAADIAGTITQDGQPAFVARRTVVIPGKDATYLLALDAQGAEAEQGAITEAMSVIDSQATIEP